MSELLRARITAIPKFAASTSQRPSLLGEMIGKMARTLASQVEAMARISASGLEPSSAVRLMALNRALRSPKLSQLGEETTRRLSRSTARVIEGIEKIAAGGPASVTRSQIGRALSEMMSAVRSAHRTLARMEQGAIADELSSVLSSRGYTVRMRQIGDESLLRAKKGENVVVAKVTGSGTMEMDMAGFVEGECSKERREIIRELEARGYRMKVERRVVHNLRRGGALVEEVERRLQEVEEQLKRLNLAKAQRSKMRARR